MRTTNLILTFFTLAVAFGRGDPILVYGSGTYYLDPVSADSSFQYSFSGSDGVDSVGVSFSSYNLNCLGGCYGSAFIDGIFFPAYSFRFSLGDNGFVAGYNPQTNERAFVAIVGYLHESGCTFSIAPCSGTLTVDQIPPPVPEPAAASLILSCLGAVALGAAVKKCARSTADDTGGA